MINENDKASVFAGRLWDNPSLAGLSPLQKEEQLRQFLDVNVSTLQPTMASAEFFPNVPWRRVRELLGKAISDLANRSLAPLYDAVLEKKIDFTFALNMAHRSATLADISRQLGEYLRKLSEKAESRRELIGPLMGVGTGLVDKYMDRIFQRQKYTHFELRKVQRLKISSKGISDLVKTTMLVRPSIHYFSAGEKNVLQISPAFAGRVARETVGVLTLMPEEVIKAGVNSGLSFQDNPSIESTARLAAVFSHRCRNLRPGMEVDRGAESSDKSWFSVARKNYKFYGFDLDMLVELHSIAAENGW